jgi:hypothetical protein
MIKLQYILLLIHIFHYGKAWNPTSFPVIDAEIAVPSYDRRAKPIESRSSKTYQELLLPTKYFRPFVQNNGYGNNLQAHAPQRIQIVQWMKKEGDSFKKGDTILILEGDDEFLGENHGLRIKKGLIAAEDGILVRIKKFESEIISFHDDFEADIVLRTNSLAIIQSTSFINVEIDSNTLLDVQIQQERHEEQRKTKAKRLAKETTAKNQERFEKLSELTRWKAEAKQKTRNSEQATERNGKDTQLTQWKDDTKKKLKEAKQRGELNDSIEENGEEESSQSITGSVDGDQNEQQDEKRSLQTFWLKMKILCQHRI